MRLLEQTPDPGRCWARYGLHPWPGSAGLWIDLFSRGLGKASKDAFDTRYLDRRRDLDDVVYLPPVDRGWQAFREELARRFVARGTPVLVQSLPGEELASPGTCEVVDVLPTVVTGDLTGLKNVAAGSKVIWPLISGYTDRSEQWEEGLETLAEGGITHVLGIAAELVPADRRRIVEVAGEKGFEDLFHGPAPQERDFGIRVARSGMKPFLRRPLPAASSWLVNNRRVAGQLASIGELWLRLGRSESRGQAFYRAARWVDRDKHDLIALAREGNLGVVKWLDEDSRQVIEEVARRDDSGLREELLQEYLSATGI